MSYLTQINLHTDHGVYRILWIKEQLGRDPGIRYGMYGSTQGAHHSYYSNGYRHNEIAGEVLEGTQFWGLPFSEIEEHIQLVNVAIPVQGRSNLSIIGNENNNTDPTPQRLLSLNLNDYSELLSVHYFLVKTGKEGDFLRSIATPFFSDIVGIEFIKLHHFQDLKLGVVLLNQDNNVS